MIEVTVMKRVFMPPRPGNENPPMVAHSHDQATFRFDSVRQFAEHLLEHSEAMDQGAMALVMYPVV